MYERHFGLTATPFPTPVDGSAVFVGPQQAKLMKSLNKNLKAVDSIAVISGRAGVGKSTVVGRALESLSPARTVVRIGRIRLAANDVLELLLAGFGVDCKRLTTIQRIAAFRRILAAQETTGSRITIVVEDAERLGADALVELEALTAADFGDANGANLILMGQPSLRDWLKNASLERIQQRARAWLEVEPFALAEVQGYLRNGIRAAGGQYDAVFSDNAATTLHRCSEGVPRVINSVCEAALAAAADTGVKPLGSKLLLQQASELLGVQIEASTADADESADSSYLDVPVLTPEIESSAAGVDTGGLDATDIDEEDDAAATAESAAAATDPSNSVAATATAGEADLDFLVDNAAEVTAESVADDDAPAIAPALDVAIGADEEIVDATVPSDDIPGAEARDDTPVAETAAPAVDAPGEAADEPLPAAELAIPEEDAETAVEDSEIPVVDKANIKDENLGVDMRLQDADESPATAEAQSAAPESPIAQDELLSELPEDPSPTETNLPVFTPHFELDDTVAPLPGSTPTDAESATDAEPAIEVAQATDTGNDSEDYADATIAIDDVAGASSVDPVAQPEHVSTEPAPAASADEPMADDVSLTAGETAVSESPVAVAPESMEKAVNVAEAESSPAPADAIDDQPFESTEILEIPANLSIADDTPGTAADPFDEPSFVSTEVLNASPATLTLDEPPSMDLPPSDQTMTAKRPDWMLQTDDVAPTAGPAELASPAIDESDVPAVLTAEPEPTQRLQAIDPAMHCPTAAAPPADTEAPSADAAPTDLPELTLDDSLEKARSDAEEPKPQAKIDPKIVAELSKATSLDDLDDEMAATLFGDEDFEAIAAAAVANVPANDDDAAEAGVSDQATAGAAVAVGSDANAATPAPAPAASATPAATAATPTAATTSAQPTSAPANPPAPAAGTATVAGQAPASTGQAPSGKGMGYTGEFEMSVTSRLRMVGELSKDKKKPLQKAVKQEAPVAKPAVSGAPAKPAAAMPVKQAEPATNDDAENADEATADDSGKKKRKGLGGLLSRFRR